MSHYKYLNIEEREKLYLIFMKIPPRGGEGHTSKIKWEHFRLEYSC